MTTPPAAGAEGENLELLSAKSALDELDVDAAVDAALDRLLGPTPNRAQRRARGQRGRRRTPADLRPGARSRGQ